MTRLTPSRSEQQEKELPGFSAGVGCRLEEGFGEGVRTVLSELLESLESREDLVELFSDGRLGRAAQMIVDQGLKIGSGRLETAGTGEDLFIYTLSLDEEKARAALRTMDFNRFFSHEGPP